MNNLSIIGNLAGDVELGETKGGTAAASFRLAVTNPRNRDGDAFFFSVEVYGAEAKRAGEYLAKGRQVAISGAITHEQWTDKDGGYRERVKIVADRITYLAGARRTDANDEAQEG